jgi:hypothetical protein
MSEKFTPGPWKALSAQYGNDVIAPNALGVKIAFCGRAAVYSGEGNYNVGNDESFYNAHLIAAAPDMYKQLAFLIDVAWDAMYLANKDFGELDDKFLDGPKAALAKARGEQ